MKVGIFTSAQNQQARDLVAGLYYYGIKKAIIPDLEIAFVMVSGGSEKEERIDLNNLMVQTVNELRLPLITFPSLRFRPDLRRSNVKKWRQAHDRELMTNHLEPTDLDVMLGYMWIASPEMCQARTMLNLHPDLPGGRKGSYKKVIWRLIEDRAEESGLNMHLVTPELDEGQSIAFYRILLKGGQFDYFRKEGKKDDLFDLIRARQVARELPLVVWTLRALAERQLVIEGDKVINFLGEVLPNGYDATREIDYLVKHIL